MAQRYRTRRDTALPGTGGFSVYDLWTGKTVVLALTPQDGLSREDAEQTAAMLNTQRDRTVLQ